jgi:DNA invertase Pin-like site-specific DNA recombinase
MRLLAPRRLSRKTDESVSIETQTIGIDDWAGANGHVIVKATEDLDVSGGVPIRERPDIGPWLTPEHLDDWDGLVLYKIDRGFRNHYDFVTFVHDFCEPHGKVIISVGEGIDTSASMGKFMLGMLVQFAEWELTRMKERRRDAAKRLRSSARWNGGTVSYGYRPVCLCHHDAKCPSAPRTAGWEIEPDPETAPVVRKMADMAIAGQSASAIVRWLNDEGVPTPQHGAEWRKTSVLAVLRNPGLRGFVVQSRPDGTGRRYIEPKIIRNDDGTPVRREPILDDETWFRLQAALDRMSRGHGVPRSDGHPLLGVAFCGKDGCGAPLYALRQTSRHRKNVKTYMYYACSARSDGECDAKGIPMADLDARMLAEMTAAYRKILYPEKVVTPGVDHAAEIAVIDARIAELDQAHKDGELHTRAYSRQVSELETIRDTLEAEQTPGGVEYVDADDTVAERFAAADLEGRREIMLALGIRVKALLISKGNIAVSLTKN